MTNTEIIRIVNKNGIKFHLPSGQVFIRKKQTTCVISCRIAKIANIMIIELTESKWKITILKEQSVKINDNKSPIT